MTKWDSVSLLGREHHQWEDSLSSEGAIQTWGRCKWGWAERAGGAGSLWGFSSKIRGGFRHRPAETQRKEFLIPPIPLVYLRLLSHLTDFLSTYLLCVTKMMSKMDIATTFKEHRA